MMVINLWGSPGSGKSTTAAGLFHKMKMADYNVELINEFAKDVTWEGHGNMLLDQLYISAQQNRKLERLRGKVEYCITDSPLLLCLAYKPENYYTLFDDFVKQVWDSYNNMNFLLQRTYPYRPNGRYHTEDQSAVIERDIRDILHHYEQEFTFINGGDAADYIFSRIQEDDLQAG